MGEPGENFLQPSFS